ncbi:MAG: UbiA family prenyltransferase [Chitinophagaceae bacterium]|nr:UbiA family prenyltransferase [Chitinophagaceae bacterium]
MVKNLRFFIVYSNFFIATCALSLTYETFILLGLPPSLNWYLILIFFGTVFIYGLHYFVKSRNEKSGSRMDWCRQNEKFLLSIIFLSFILISCVAVYHYKSIFEKFGAFNYPNLAWFIIIPLLALGYSYPLNPWNKKSLRQIGWLKMASLSFIWSFTTVVLPVLMLPDETSGFTNNTLLVLFINRFFFIAALSLLFNIKDYEEDKQDGIKTIAVLMGPAKSLRYGKIVMPLLSFISALWLLFTMGINKPVFYAAFFIPILLLFLLYYRFSHMKDEAAFVIRYDGLMIVKALLLIFAFLIGSS